MKYLGALLCLLACVLPAHAADTDLRDSRVHIPWSDFREIVKHLTDRTTSATRDSSYAPVPYLISSVRLDGMVHRQDAARISALVDLTVLPSEELARNGWVSVPMQRATGGSTALLERALVDGKPAPLHQRDGGHSLLFSRAGRYRVTLDYYCPVANAEGTLRTSMALPRAAAGWLELRIPGMHADLWLGERKQEVTFVNNATRFAGVIDPSDVLRIRYSPSADGLGDDTREGAQMTPKVFAVTGMLVSIKENRINYHYRIDYEIWHQKRNGFALLLPDSFAVENIHGPGLARWDVHPSDSGHMLQVQTSFSAERTYSFTVQFSERLQTASARVRVPVPRVLDVDRESGFIAVQATETMEVFSGDSTADVSGVPARELPQWLQTQSDILLRFKYNRRPFRLDLDITRHRDMPVLVAVADEALFTGLVTRNGHVLAKYRYLIRNNQKQYLRITMEPEWALWSALIDGRAVMPASTDSAATVLVPLRKMSAAEKDDGFVLELVYWRHRPKMGYGGRIDFAVPVIDINCQQYNGELWLPSSYSYGTPGGAFEQVRSYHGSRLLTSSAPGNAGGRRKWMAQSNTFVAAKQGKALSLPVEIEVPTHGVVRRFTRKLTVAGEEAGIRLGYRRELPAVRGALKWALWLLVLAIGFMTTRAVLRLRGEAPIKGPLIAGIVTV
ncbi:MAG: hypothetical protein GF331_03175, partial [Chitinivibrionales bacterium]|nr:hypothetical protein [Chitinivibrionales bacterium]